MKKKALAIGGIAVTAALVGGWALAQTASPGPGGFGPPFMHAQGAQGMGPGMTEHMGRGMGHGMDGARNGAWHDGARNGAWHDGARNGAWHDGARMGPA